MKWVDVLRIAKWLNKLVKFILTELDYLFSKSDKIEDDYKKSDHEKRVL